ncbi:7-carboxy-7-deazaguanine synthase QueE [Thermoproteota archaeon]
MTIQITDVFFSFQGEGLFIGYPQIFVRLYGCNLACDYCDEPDNPSHIKEYEPEQLADIVKPLYKHKPHSIVLTGGEPLLQIDGLKTLIPLFKLPVFLETNGTLPSHLAEIMELISFFSVDYKPDFYHEFIDFIKVLKDKDNVYVKYILKYNFNILELQQLIKILEHINPNIPLILQPVTPFSKIKRTASLEDIMRAYTLSSKSIKTVRLIPQTHKRIGIK